MKYGDIDNTEKKFISTNIVYLNKYLEKLEIIDDVYIIYYFFFTIYKFYFYIFI